MSIGSTESKTERKVSKMNANTIKTIVEVLVAIVGFFGLSFIVVLAEYDWKVNNRKYREEHRKKVYDWVLGLRKDFPTFCLVLSFLFLSSSLCFAELDPNNPSSKYPVGGGRVLTQEECAYNEAHGIYAVNDKRAKPLTADQVAEFKFADENMGRDAQGNAVVIPKATGKRQVISSRLALTPDGQLEGIPTGDEMAEHRKAIAEVRKRNQDNARKAGLHFEDLPEEKEKIGKGIVEEGEKHLQKAEERLAQNEKDKKGETEQYQYKTLVSFETQRP